MDLGLRGRRALVTGASAGLGAATAETLVAEGCETTIVSRSQKNLDRAAARIQDTTGVAPRTIVSDVSVAGEAERLTAELGAVDILVANTGGPPPGLFLEHPPERWQAAHDLLVGSAMSLTKAVLPSMMDHGWGRVVYITSVAVLQPIDDLILSNAYRAAVTGMCKTLANTYSKHGITFNCVCPGFTATERLQSLAEGRAEQAGVTAGEILKRFAGQTAVGRVGRPDELAALIAFLVGDRAAYITGASIPVDGGLYRGLL